MATRVRKGKPVAGAPQLDLFERKQLERAIGQRKRYRYVRPKVRVVPEGVLIESPCCSRRIDEEGGIVDIALLQREPAGGWRLYYKNHATGVWTLHSLHEHLAELVEPLKEDPERIFWQ